MRFLPYLKAVFEIYMCGFFGSRIYIGIIDTGQNLVGGGGFIGMLPREKFEHSGPQRAGNATKISHL
jgi:hypothetical protein